MNDTKIRTVGPKYNQGVRKYLTNRQIKQKDKVVEGTVVNNFIKNEDTHERPNLDDTYDTLLIPGRKVQSVQPETKTEHQYDVKKAMLPLIIGAASVFGATTLMGLILKNSAKKITTEPFKNQLPAMGINLNIVEETGFATYMALRDPSKTNLLAGAAVFAFSALTLVGKKFIEGIKEIWTKKQEANIQHNLQEDMIEVETREFSGKLDVVRNMLSEKGEYFKASLNGQNQKKALDTQIYDKYFNFMGNQKEKKKEDFRPYLLISGAMLALGALTAGITFKNIKTSAKVMDEYAANFLKKKDALLKDILSKKNKDSKAELLDVLIKMGASKDKAIECAQQIGLEGEELEKFANTVASDVNSIWGNAPTGMSTESGKSFFYCYINETRGHLYNWLIHKENKFLRNLFYAMALISGGSYISQQSTEALKNVAVAKENAKTDLELQKRLVEVEIKNFKAKKESALKPLIEDFEEKRRQGKSPQELKVMADNILLEIKNGPPFVYS